MVKKGPQISGLLGPRLKVLRFWKMNLKRCNNKADNTGVKKAMMGTGKRLGEGRGVARFIKRVLQLVNIYI